MRSPRSADQFLLLVFVLVVMVSIIQPGAFNMALDKLELSTNSAMLILICTLMASTINLPLFSIYLINTCQLSLFQVTFVIAAITMLCRLFSRPVPGPGIGIAVFIAPISAAPTSLSLVS